MSTTTRRLRSALLALPVAVLAAGTYGCGGGGGTADSGGAKATICVGGEFSTRPDGLPGLQKAYGFTFKPDNVKALDEDALVYTQVDSGGCTFGSIAATDGRVGALGLTVLADDKGFFPPYNGSLNVRTEVLDRAPGIRELFARIGAALDDKTMITLNRQVDVDGRKPEDAARGWLDAHKDLVPRVDLSGQTFKVGSKEFTEQLVLGHLTRQVLEGAGATVDAQIGLVGSETVRSALTSGRIDLYWEYLGTGWVNYLKNTEAIADPKKQYEAVRDADRPNGVTWLEPTPFNDTYALTMTDERAAELNVKSISDIARLIAADG
jgi:osmoprotectant transport system substrate-binding protein